jgi:hypothetical protein
MKMMNAEDDYSINFTNRKAPAVVAAVEAGVAAYLFFQNNGSKMCC